MVGGGMFDMAKKATTPTETLGKRVGCWTLRHCFEDSFAGGNCAEIVFDRVPQAEASLFVSQNT